MERRSRLLIVDDNPEITNLLTEMLGIEGYEVIIGHNGEEGLELVARHHPDLIILDVVMPKLDGFEVLKRLKSAEESKFIPVIMLTGKGEVESKVIGLETGADDYLAKPFNRKEITARIKSLLSIRAVHEKMAEEEKTEALTYLVDELTHEIRNPIVVIGGFAKKVYDGLPEDDVKKEYMRKILENVVRLENMIRHLVDLKAIVLSAPERSDINALVREVAASWRGKCEAGRIILELRLAAGECVAAVDRASISRALSNIIENAVEATELAADRRIILQTEVMTGSVEILVRDSGAGIPRDTLKNIFDPFFTSKINGPGLGLTLASKIVKYHGGSISVESEQGRGSTFTVRLPATPATHVSKSG